MKRMIKSTLIRAALGLCVAGAWPLAAQGIPSFDSSGNSLLNGAYYFRETFFIVADASGDFNRALSLYGNISFNGSGAYTISNAQVMDSSVGQPDPLACYLAQQLCSSSAATVSGTYTISAGGYGYVSNPLSSGDQIYVVVGNSGNTTGGLVTGSSTEGGFNDLFIAGLISSPPASTGTFNGAWTMAGYIPGGTPAGGANLFFQLNPNGAGSLGNVSASGYIGGAGTAIQTQNISSVKYIFSSGAAVLQFPVSTSTTAFYFSGNEYLYFSPDGNFAFGGSPNGYDMLVGIRNDSSGTIENFSGLYVQSGIDQDLSQYATTGFADFDTYYGSLSTAAGANIVGVQRLQDVFDPNAFSSSFSDTYPVPIVGSGAIKDGYTQYAYGDGGTVRIGSGIWPYLGVTVAFQAPVPKQTSSVFLNPVGITNAASSAPFTAGISNGELLTLYGANLAPSLAVAPGVPFPTTLNGVQVTINGQAAPIYYVSPGQVSVIVPYENPYSVAAIQVYNGAPSNVVTAFVDKTSAGLFTQNAAGYGDAALIHNATGLPVTELNPAQPGEYVQAFVTGLGAVFPAVADGAAGPTTNLSYSQYFSTTASQNLIAAYVGGVSAPVVFAGLAPGLAGLYQIDLQIPTGLTPGDNEIDISGPDSYTSEALIPVGGLLADESSQTTAAKDRRKAPKRQPVRPTLRQGPVNLAPGPK